MGERSPLTQQDGFKCGEDQSFVWTVYQTNKKDVQDINGWSLEWKMATAKGGTAVLTKPAVIENPGGGTVRVSFAVADTINLPGRKYYYELSRTDITHNNVVADGDWHLLPRIA